VPDVAEILRCQGVRRYLDEDDGETDQDGEIGEILRARVEMELALQP
jgi:hypothetical protein